MAPPGAGVMATVPLPGMAAPKIKVQAAAPKLDPLEDDSAML
ncbi:hypothetical protein AIOL_000615 [Candidatus Rhodobacter oscarellae]|uniref:Uncharacterized protein n=1 Tax=Candidatus Rhodobacter oscarellae TaxID=1675527 RepID=A0A0J9EFK2_9RHOB|nr:hypothetical protein [Candidatus Rhodobacter lobularis]KMW60459.1 hypothetical protein AIOL_000615 [Candidatus Rhodobacter lobularis]